MNSKQTFDQNELIQEMSTEKRWTVSTNDKKPLNFDSIIQNKKDPTERIHMFSYNKENKEYGLERLDKIEEQARTYEFESNRAFRLNAKEDHIICLDIEPAKAKDYLNEWSKLPIKYLEYSTHYGYHALIKIPEDIVNKKKYADILDKTVIADKPTDKEMKKRWEILMNNHFVTFTKNIIQIDSIKPPISDKDERDNLTHFLDQLVEQSKESTTNVVHVGAIENVSEFELDLYNKIQYEYKEQIVEKMDNTKLSELNNDESRYEYVAALKLTNIIDKYMALNEVVLPDNKTNLSDNQAVNVLYLMLSSWLPYRKKHDEQRDKMPWLKYVALNAYTYHQNNKTTVG